MGKAKSLTIALVASGVVLTPSVSAFAAQTCDAYSQNCTHVGGKKIIKPPTAVEPDQATLPFTGAEILGMSAAGAAALGGGVVLVVAGRRRRRASTD